jgi:hypothetical protein
MQSCLYKYFPSRVEITGDQPILIKSSPWYDEPKFRYPVQNKNCREKASASSKEKRLQNKLKWLMSLSYPYLRKPRKDREDLEFRRRKMYNFMQQATKTTKLLCLIPVPQQTSHHEAIRSTRKGIN